MCWPACSVVRFAREPGGILSESKLVPSIHCTLSPALLTLFLCMAQDLAGAARELAAQVSQAVPCPGALAAGRAGALLGQLEGGGAAAPGEGGQASVLHRQVCLGAYQTLLGMEKVQLAVAHCGMLHAF